MTEVCPLPYGESLNEIACALVLPLIFIPTIATKKYKQVINELQMEHHYYFGFERKLLRFLSIMNE